VIDCHCDVCRPNFDSVAAADGAMPVLSDEVVLLVRQLLSAIARLHGKFGVGMVAEVLAGAENDKMLRWRFHELTVFGLLRAHSSKRIVAMLHRLMEAGLARQRDPEGVMKGQQMPPASLADLVPRRAAVPSNNERRRVVPADRAQKVVEDDLPPEAQHRFERLRAVRAQLAKERDLPPYCICHDKTLKLIAQFAPADPDALEQVKGMGPHKVKMYGPALLEALQ
jgi:ATP-dependent DNA helicase RecQ